jgi:hypothetical protein
MVIEAKMPKNQRLMESGRESWTPIRNLNLLVRIPSISMKTKKRR